MPPRRAARSTREAADRATYAEPVGEFTGFSDAALDFYEDLELDNSKAFWQAHRQVYETQVLAPMLALTAALAPEFGAAKVFRPYRDVRFSKDKSPYKTGQGAVVAVAPATGWHVEISAAGVGVGAGFYEAGPERLGVIRDAIVAETTGAQLQKLLAGYAADGWDIGGDRLRTAPRGYSVDHPRIDLLRYKQLVVRRSYGVERLDRPDVVDRVRADWRALRPLVDWLAARTA